MRRMKLFSKVTIYLLFLSLLSVFLSCENDKDNDNEMNLEGIYIVNEGQFGNNNGSISLLDPETYAVSNNYFQQQNDKRSLGDIVQGLSFSSDKGFIVVNNSQKMEIVDKETFETIDVIENLSYPRQFLPVNDEKGYLTDGSSADGNNGHILVIDLESYEISDSIEVGKGPESMLHLDDKMFVTNAGGYLIGNTVSIINVNTDEVEENIEVHDVPTDIIADKNNDIWVYCKGDYQTGDEGELVKISNDDYTTQSFPIGNIASYGNYLLAIDSDKESFYYVGSAGIYNMNIDESEAPGEPVIEELPYGLDVNPANGDIYCLTSDSESKGNALKYNQEYELVDSIQVGYGPNAVVFE
ncbi:MAG: hypothetical protein R6U04_00965 [Bacteroidales bacterium]